jgi:uncharacterized membrane protein
MNETAVTAIIASLALIALHYFNWRALLGSHLGRLASYTIGVLALIVPLTVMWLMSGLVSAVISMWSVVVAGGASVGLCYLTDYILANRSRVRELEERENQLRSCVDEQA